MECLYDLYHGLSNCNMRVPAEFGCEPGEFCRFCYCLARWIRQREKMLEWKELAVISISKSKKKKYTH